MATEGTMVADLRAEIERLYRELDLASTEKIQSAQYGLALLEEKSALEQKCSDLESLYENTKHELDITQEALAKFQTTTKLTTKSGIEQEESLLHESAARETSLQTEIIELENEAKQLRHELERVQAERDHALQEREEVGKDHLQTEAERKTLRTELRECRFRETRLLQDYTELEDENISLQKQVSGLRSSQVEFEGVKHEIRRLTEEVELLNSQVEELSNLKKIAEKQMEEALESLQAEREAKYALKKELDQRINSESIYNLSNLALSIRGITDDQNICSDGENDSPALRRIEDDLKTQEPGTSAAGKQVDLFSEIHLNELKKLEKQLELAESEKSLLTQNLRESQYAVEKSQGELQSFVARIVQLAAHVQSLHHLHSKLPEQKGEETALDKLNQAVVQYHQWSTMSAREIEQLQKDLVDLEEGLTVSDSTQQLRTELTNLRNKKFSQELLNVKVVDWVTRKYLPFSFFEDDETQSFFTFLNPNAKLPRRNQLKVLVKDRFTKQQRSVMHILKTNESKISCTLDGWTSIAGRSYYCITGHFIGEDWKLHSLLIDFCPSKGEHTGRDIAALFFNAVNDFGIKEKILGITVDNTASNTTFMWELSFLMDFDHENQHFQCYAHIVNLGVQDLLKDLKLADSKEFEEQEERGGEEEEEEEKEQQGQEKEERAKESKETNQNVDIEENFDDCNTPIAKLRKLFKFLKRSEQWRTKLEYCCASCNIKMISPNVDVSTRWNSTSDMISSGLKMQEGIILLCNKNKYLEPLSIDSQEWLILQKVNKYLRYFKVLSTILSGDKYVTLPYVVVGFNMLLDKLEESITNLNSKSEPVDQQIQKALQKAREKLMKHYNKSNWVYCAVLILDPRHKIEQFKKTSWGQEMAKYSQTKFEEIYRTKYYVPDNTEV